ncbi:hypothetical protein [Streptomyces sp. I05A-00742]|uniref:hypothetical protein n=1 Tax=Streptomyces sp. I05A-00742 TaxID=2732853 RepID=UPI001488F56B|nr:hypothetical protein [Streptomyces sp. I05A-00742]
MRSARIPLLATAAAALALTAAAPAPAAPADEDTRITRADPAPLGGEAEFVVSITNSAAEHVGSVVVESPAFTSKVTVGKRNFGHNKADDTTMTVRGRVRCDAEPGEHPVTVRLDGKGKPAASTRLTVTSARTGACAEDDGSDGDDRNDPRKAPPSAAPALKLRTGGREPQRGDEAVFTITTDRATLDEHDALTLRSPAFVTPVKRLTKNFKEGKGPGRWTDLAGMVRCDIKPGTYAVDLVADGEDDDSPLHSVKFTVPERLDPANRDFCAGPHAYKEIVDRTSETAPDEDGDGGSASADRDDDGLGTGTVVGISSAAALVAASVTYFLVARRRRRTREAGDSW